jgi:hypothetical protein
VANSNPLGTGNRIELFIALRKRFRNSVKRRWRREKQQELSLGQEKK